MWPPPPHPPPTNNITPHQNKIVWLHPSEDFSEIFTHALPKLEGEYMPFLIYVYSIQIFRVLDHSHDHTSLYYCHPKFFLYYALGKEDTTGICLQRNLKITLSQFHSFAAVSVFSDWLQNVKQDRKSFITLSKFKSLMCLCLWSLLFPKKCGPQWPYFIFN